MDKLGKEKKEHLELLEFLTFNEPEPIREDFPVRKHSWKMDGSEIDVFAIDSDIHNGPRCVVCGFGECEHCNPEVYNDESCAYEEALNKWLDEKWRIDQRNKEIKAINKELKKRIKILITNPKT